jgi:hypothetical protein
MKLATSATMTVCHVSSIAQSSLYWRTAKGSADAAGTLVS